MKREKNWTIKYDIPDIPRELLDAGYNPLLASILCQRGYTDAEKAKLFLESKTDSIHDPRGIKGMDAAVVRIKKAILNKEKIAVYGDYDVDGITATALLTDYLKSRGVEVDPYIPDRNNEGYGLKKEALKKFKELGVSLIVTVDCGITSKDEAEFATELGMDLIVTDHHECKGSSLPECCAVIDCKQEGDEYPNPNLAGVGMAFKLVCAIDGNLSAMLNRYCDLLAVGTVADVMPLTDENRTFVKHGLDKLTNNPRTGIRAIMKEASMSNGNMTASSISYILAPRLNAAGRLGRAICAEQLLLTDDTLEAEKIASELCELNIQRQRKENQIWEEAFALLKDHDRTKPIVLFNKEWEPGVIGIAASRLAEHFGVPAIIICKSGDSCNGKGSCRSFGGFNLFDALQECSENLISFGGHALAAGLNIEEGRVDAFRNQLTEYYLKNKPDTPKLEFDMLISDPEILSVENVRSLDLLEPCGNANPRPVLCMIGVLLEHSLSVGSGKHLKMKINCRGQHFDCIYFSCSIQDLGVKDGDYIDIAFTPTINEYRNTVSVQLNLSAVRKHDSYDLCEDIRNDIKYLKALSQFAPERQDFVSIWDKDNNEVLQRSPKNMVDEKYWICRRVLEDAELIDKDGKFLETDKKIVLEETPLMKALNEQ